MLYFSAPLKSLKMPTPPPLQLPSLFDELIVASCIVTIGLMMVVFKEHEGGESEEVMNREEGERASLLCFALLWGPSR